MKQPQSQLPPSFNPIQDMHFKGLHWIEASAGTGKTFTLSSLMVRILLEAYLPEQVIATTFTRAAAAELKSRIRERLEETRQIFRQCLQLAETEVQAKARENSHDPLLEKVLMDYASKVDYAYNRLTLVIHQLDELFVGTLDSFSQKLLREFSFESGKIERAEITDDAKQYTQQLIHDVLREWIQQQPQDLIDYLVLNNKLQPAEYYISVADTALNFSSAHFQPVNLSDLDIAAFEAQLSQLSGISSEQLKELEPYFLESGSYYKLVNKTAFRSGKFSRIFQNSLPQLIAKLNRHGIKSYFHNSHQALITDIQSLFFNSKSEPRDSVFKACPEDVQQAFYQHPVMLLLKQLVDQEQRFKQQLDILPSYLKFYLAQQVKKRLPQLLQQKGETTFSQQIRTLAEALHGEQGQRFAKYVQERYPLILVDEFQDTNQDQDDMLSAIWRDARHLQRGGMIMVGDPKQAIYGFRGGDMLTYNKARADIYAKQGRLYSLRNNQRSVAELVSVVNELFERGIDFGEQVIYHPVQAGTRPHARLVDANGQNHRPLRWLTFTQEHVSQELTEHKQVAWKIHELLQQARNDQLYFVDQHQNQTALTENDIAVLANDHADLEKVQNHLEKLGIQCLKESKQSVFSSMIAQDVGALLSAILHPYDEGKIKRALLSRLLGGKVQDLQQLETQAEGLSQFCYDFDCIRDMWLNKGFLTAWQYALNLFNVWQNLVASDSRDNERVVVNLRHLTEILSQHSKHYQGPQALYNWYFKQLNSPALREWEKERKLCNDSGVKLMTIHASKGLEFSIVFLLGANTFKDKSGELSFTTQPKTNPVTGAVAPQRVIAISDKQLPEQDQQQDLQRRLAEHYRLWYVALTRASHRVYALLQESQTGKQGALGFWLEKPAVNAEIVARYSTQEPLLTEKPLALLTQKHDIPLIQAAELPRQRFYPRSKTSFSALSQHLSRKQIMDALVAKTEAEPSAADENNLAVEEQTLVTVPIAWIKSHFPMGTLAGNFLHEIFEHIDFHDRSLWPLELHRRFKNDYPTLWQELSGAYQKEFGQVEDEALIGMLADWCHDVLHTPLHDRFYLQQLRAGQHLAEFPFYLSLSDRVLAIQRISQLFHEYAMAMPDFNEAQSARYLNGSIDLVYFDGQRYHLADYKSNYLGNDQSCYTATAIADNMSHSSYWLQAGLYLVALHRYLKVSLQGYEIATHLGGATYLYLRGMNGTANTGVLHWKPDAEFVLRLDAILGSLAEDKPGVLSA